MSPITMHSQLVVWFGRAQMRFGFVNSFKKIFPNNGSNGYSPSRVVATRVKEASDWLNLYRASPSFEDLVGADRTQILFPLILPHVIDYIVERRAIHHLWRTNVKDLLTLRLVSKGWRGSVDSMMEEKPMSDTLKMDCCSKYVFWKADRLCSFLNKFQGHSIWNPIIYGQVTLLIGDYNTEEYVTCAARLMAKFGSGVKTLVLPQLHCVTSTMFNTEQSARRVRRLVQLAPNLEHLEMSVVHGPVVASPASIGEPGTNDTEPPLVTSLKSLTIHGMEFVRDSEAFQNLFLTMLSSSRNTLQKVDLQEVPSELVSHPNLSSATFRLSTKEQNLSRLRSCSWPLFQLTLHDYKHSLQVILRNIEHFKATLSSLRILNSSKASQHSNIKIQMDFPVLKSLAVEVIAIPEIICGNLPKLELLEVGRWMSCSSQVQRFEYLGEVPNLEVFQSNIWKVLPKLQKVIIRVGQVMNDCWGQKIVSREQVDSHWRRSQQTTGGI